MAVIEVGEPTVKLVALVPLNVTVVAPVKFWPVIVTLVPTDPLLGVVVRRLSARPARKKARAVLCITLFWQFRWIARSCHARGCACAGGARDRRAVLLALRQS
jgi:hypothetical protein